MNGVSKTTQAFTSSHGRRMTAKTNTTTTDSSASTHATNKATTRDTSKYTFNTTHNDIGTLGSIRIPN
eukprot:8677014-Pyramimonas_sp.AAC.1